MVPDWLVEYSIANRNFTFGSGNLVGVPPMHFRMPPCCATWGPSCGLPSRREASILHFAMGRAIAANSIAHRGRCGGGCMYCTVCGYESDECGPVCSRCGSDVPDQAEEKGNVETGGCYPCGPDDGDMLAWNESGQLSRGESPDSSVLPVSDGGGQLEQRSDGAVFEQGKSRMDAFGRQIGDLGLRGTIALALLAIAIVLALVALACVVAFRPTGASSGASSGASPDTSASAPADGESTSGFSAKSNMDGKNGLKSVNETVFCGSRVDGSHRLA